MAAVHDSMWERLSETNYGGFCVAVQLISDRSWIPEEVGHEATGYYERLLSAFTELIEESQEAGTVRKDRPARSEEHTSELQSRQYLVCRLLLEKKKKQ